MNSALTAWAGARRALAEQAALGVVGIDRGRGVRFSGIVWDSETLVTAAERLHGDQTAIILLISIDCAYIDGDKIDE